MEGDKIISTAYSGVFIFNTFELWGSSLDVFYQFHCIFWGFFGFWEWSPLIGRKVGTPKGILPYVQTGLIIGNPY